MAECNYNHNTNSITPARVRSPDSTHAPTRLQIRAIPTSSSDGTAQTGNRIVQIQMSHDYLEQFQIIHISPQPEQTIAQPDSYVYRFLTSQSSQPISVTIDLEPEQMGWVNGEIGLDTEPSLEFGQWIYP
ncbi:hypothetical protein AB3R30_20350 [Leptolyngbyaceae cyanobacterium UHCC 1019]